MGDKCRHEWDGERQTLGRLALLLLPACCLREFFMCLVIFWMASESFWIVFSAAWSLWVAFEANGQSTKRQETKTKPQNSSFPLLLSQFKAPLSIICPLWITGGDLFQVKCKAEHVLKKERQCLWRDNRCPLGLLPRNHPLHHSPQIPWSAWLEVLHSQRQGDRDCFKE